MLALEQLLIFRKSTYYKEVKCFLSDLNEDVCNSSWPVRFRPPAKRKM